MLNNLQTPSQVQAGYYGKVPSKGDFVSHRLPREFVEPWDTWLQSAIGSSRNRLVDKWLETYLTSPFWCYYLSPGLCSRNGWAGVLMPSVDKVGRYFPLTITCPVPITFNPFNLMVDKAQWFRDVEQLMLTLLEDSLTDLSEFDQRVTQLGCLFDNSIDEISDYSKQAKEFQGKLGLSPNWRLPITGIDDVQMSCTELSRRMLETRFSSYSLWWSNGSEQVDPSLLVSAGLPTAESFSSLLDGRWREGTWEEWPVLLNSGLNSGSSIDGSEPEEIVSKSKERQAPENEDAPLIEQIFIPELSIDQMLPPNSDQMDVTEDAPPLTWMSSSSSHVGKLRTANEDTYLSRPEIGLWAVADGMGGHTAGELASVMTTYYLSNIEPAGRRFDRFVNDAKNRLQTANKKLVEMAREQDVSTIGCTIAVLMVMGRRAAFLWAGDARIYRSRAGVLEQLTTDHSGSIDTDGEPCNIVTRAIGAENKLDLDIGYIELRNNDHFLICSDGLNKEVTDKEIAKSLNDDENVLDATQTLIDLTLDRGARDNVTIVTVKISAAPDPGNEDNAPVNEKGDDVK